MKRRNESVDMSSNPKKHCLVETTELIKHRYRDGVGKS